MDWIKVKTIFEAFGKVTFKLTYDRYYLKSTLVSTIR